MGARHFSKNFNFFALLHRRGAKKNVALGEMRREKEKKMSGTVDHVKVVDLLVDTIKELNQPDPVPAGAADAAAAAAAEHSADSAGSSPADYVAYMKSHKWPVDGMIRTMLAVGWPANLISETMLASGYSSQSITRGFSLALTPAQILELLAQEAAREAADKRAAQPVIQERVFGCTARYKHHFKTGKTVNVKGKLHDEFVECGNNKSHLKPSECLPL